MYTLSHYDAEGQRRRRTFASYSQAHKVAIETATKLAAGKPDLHVLTGNDLVVYRRAIRALSSTGTDLDVAAMQYAQPCQTLNGVTLAEAVGGVSKAD